MEKQKELWPPILFHPIVFEQPPNVPVQAAISQPEQKMPAPAEDYIPSFCCGEVDVNVPAAKPSPDCQFRQFQSHGLYAETPIRLPKPMSSEAHVEQVVAYEPKRRNPRPYDVARELLAVLPLRMVDNALYAFDGRVYRFVSTEVMYRLIMANCRRHVEVVGDASLIERVYKVIQAEPSIVYRSAPGQLRCVALEDGLLDLDNFILHPHTPVPFVTALLSGNFTRGQTSSCPHFNQFLAEVTGHDPALMERIWQTIGYALVPDNNGKCFFLLQGVPDSGKSLLTDLISSLLDEDTVTSLDLTALGERFGASELVGKQLCIVPDMPSGTLDSKSVSMLKALTGGDVVTVDVKYQPRIKLRCQAKFILATNHAVLTKDYDPAFINRAVVIPFRFTVPKEAQNHNLKEVFLMEKDAITYNAFQAYQRLREQRYQFAGRYGLNQVISKRKYYDDEVPRTSIGEVLWDFCSQNLVLEECGFVSSTDLYDCFRQVTGTSFPGGVLSFSSRVGPIIDQVFPDSVTRTRTRMTGKRKQERGFAGINLRSYFDWNEGKGNE